MENNRDQSEFNSAVAWLQRIDAVLKNCLIYASELDVNNWFHSLKAFEREISTEIKKEEFTDIETEFKKLRPSINKIIYASNTNKNYNIPSDIYDSLHTLEIKLRKIMKESGLLTRLMDDASRSLK